MNIEKEAKTPTIAPAAWVTGLMPMLALGLMLLLFSAVNPLALFNKPAAGREAFFRPHPRGRGWLSGQLINSGPHPVTIAQVMVDDAYWQFRSDPAGELPRFGKRYRASSLTNGSCRAAPDPLVTNTGPDL